MNTSLRDQLLAAGLIDKKQANEAERQQERRQRQTPAKQRSAPNAAPPPVPAVNRAQSAKLARDLELNRKQQEKARRKSVAAQVKQLVTLNRIALAEHGVPYNFVDGNKIRKITVDESVREQLGRNQIVILRFEGGYALVSSETAARIRERDTDAVFILAADRTAPATDEGYEGFAVPDDLIW